MRDISRMLTVHVWAGGKQDRRHIIRKRFKGSREARQAECDAEVKAERPCFSDQELNNPAERTVAKMTSRLLMANSALTLSLGMK